MNSKRNPVSEVLTPNEVTAFYEQGYVLVPDLFSSEEIAKMAVAFDRLKEEAIKLTEPTEIKGSYFVVHSHRIDRVVWCGAHQPSLLEVGLDPRLTGPAKQILESREMDQLICQAHFKLPADGVGFGWHQDSEHRRYGSPMWTDVNGRGSYVQTIMAIDEMHEGNGPLLMVPGSCTKGHLYLEKEEGPIPDSRWKQIQTVTMRPGTVLFLGPYTVHGSRPNQSHHPRRAFINGYSLPGANKRVYPGKGSGRRVIAP